MLMMITMMVIMIVYWKTMAETVIMITTSAVTTTMEVMKDNWRGQHARQRMPRLKVEFAFVTKQIESLLTDLYLQRRTGTPANSTRTTGTSMADVMMHNS